MTKYPLSICIPSNREHTCSKATISSALNFCDLSSSELIVSDNSADIKKSRFWENINLDFFKYDSDAPTGSYQNWHNALKKSSGLYTGILSDDDLILNIDESPVNYFEIDRNNVFGIKPIIQLWNEKVGTYSTNNFNIANDNAKDRVHTYITKANGNNTTLYSFYKKNIFYDLMELSLHHPTKGGYVDWAFVTGLVSSGKVLIDPTKLLLYKNNNWFGTKEFINEQDQKLYNSCGLSKRGSNFSPLFRALDSFIYVARKSSPVNREEIIEAAKYIFEINFSAFYQKFKNNPHLFSEKEGIVISKFKEHDSIEKKLDSSLAVIEVFKKDLVEKYLNFYNVSLEEDWGTIT